MTLPHRVPRSDADLVSDALNGDTESFAILFRRHRDSCTRFAVRVIGNAGDADDVLQGAWFRCYRSLAACRDRTRFAAWLYRIVANECRSFVIRRGRRDRRYTDDEYALERVETTVAPSATLHDDLQWALDQLNHDHREAFVLKHVEELSYMAMSEITGAGESALKMRVKRACERLRELMEERHHA